MLYESRFLVALAITLAIEVPALIVLFKFLKFKITRKIFCVGLIASTMTLPYVWFVIPAFFSGNTYVFVAEAFAVIAEAVLFFRLLELGAKESLLISAVVNMLSFVLGLLIF